MEWYRFANIDFREIELSSTANRFEIGAFPSGRIEFVEAVQNQQLRTVSQHSFRHVRTDEPGAPSQQDSSRHETHRMTSALTVP